MLDAEEYLYLAINASKAGNHHASMEYLHKCIEIEPRNAQAIYLLAAEHAELGLFDRAIEGMEAALKLDANMEMACFQLGMLYSRKGETQNAITLWTQLTEETSDKALNYFASAMLELTKNNHSDALDCFKEGLSQEQDNPALAETMRGIMTSVKEHLSKIPTDTSSGNASEDSSETRAVFLGAYKDKTLSEE